MRSPSRSEPRPWLSPSTSFVLLSAAAAWVGVVLLARGMRAAPPMHATGPVQTMWGTMGLTLGSFVGVWVLMMAAMMLPSAAPFLALYTRTFTSRRAGRCLVFVSGYLLVWAVASLPAYGVGKLVASAVEHHPGEGTALAAAVFAACGLYQLTPIKSRCLARCRSPIGLAFKYGSHRGPLRDLRAGLSHGAFCLGCCWALMAVLFAFGTMNVAAMVVLAAAVLVEKAWSRGAAFGRAVGVIALAMAVAVVIHPALAPGPHHAALGAGTGPVRQELSGPF